jgi:hypothetical protein
MPLTVPIIIGSGGGVGDVMRDEDGDGGSD